VQVNKKGAIVELGTIGGLTKNDFEGGAMSARVQGFLKPEKSKSLAYAHEPSAEVSNSIGEVSSITTSNLLSTHSLVRPRR